MCGRYTLSVPADVVAELFELATVPALEPRYNIAPTQEAPVVRRVERSPATGGEGPYRRLDLLRWGLVPYWADSPAIGNRLINARSETAAERPAFRDAFRRHRCLVVADGFYEWRREAGGKQPYWIHRPDGRAFAFAGLWSRWGRGEARFDSFTILTVEASPEIAPLHDRMPAILDPAAWDGWLDPRRSDPGDLQALLAGADGATLTLRRVARRVNTPHHDEPDCIEPLVEV
ncbi:MAG TPA: SOS response-associated peptidase [Thermoanaerobaculia bacterium]|nr:SOS response-associated peptidase [Thermoanaerobaculia bacterium]